MRHSKERKPAPLRWKLVAFVVAAVVVGISTSISDATQSVIKRSLGIFSRDPLLSVMVNPQATWTCQHPYFVARAPDVVPVPRSADSVADWSRRVNAVDAGQSQISISVQRSSSQEAILESMDVQVVARGRPLSRRVYALTDGCGSGQSPRSFVIDLDSASPRLKAVNGEANGRPTAAVDFPFKVSRGDPEIFRVVASTDHFDVKWKLRLNYVVDGSSYSRWITASGRPFETSGMSGEVNYEADFAGRQWTADPFG